MRPTIIEVLRNDHKPLPKWLQKFSPRFNLEKFLSSRTVFYPGSGTDGQPIRLCSTAHAAHTFVYADYTVSANKIVRKVMNFRGYYTERLENLDEALVCPPNGWRPREDLSGRHKSEKIETTTPYYIYLVLCRKGHFGKTHGPEKLAILFIGKDAFETFDILYCQRGRRIPYMIVVHDHGSGRNHGRFGNEVYDKDLLHNYAKRYNAQPKLLFVADNSEVWDGYERIETLPEVTRLEDGTCHAGTRRRLYRRDFTAAI